MKILEAKVFQPTNIVLDRSVPTSVTTTEFGGLRVISFESRRAKEIGRLIENKGGRATVVPAMREVEHEEHPEILEFARELLAGRIDMVIFLTGVGTRLLAGEIDKHYARTDWLPALAHASTVARGPKPVAALREIGAPVTLRAPEPNTWREVLGLLDSRHVTSIAGLRVAVQEYGLTNDHLIHGLQERGAKVLRVPVYRWALPEDTRPLQRAVKAIIHDAYAVTLFTTGTQVWHLFEVAAAMDLETPLREALNRTVIGSIGPTCSESLREFGLDIALEPEHPRMGQLVKEMAEQCHELLAEKVAAL